MTQAYHKDLEVPEKCQTQDSNSSKSATYKDVCNAAEVLLGVANKTPVATSTTLNELIGAEVFLKCENLQRIGAFKFRGAYYTMSRLSDEQKKRGVVTFSSGNHAQGVALSGKLLGIPTTVVMAYDTPQLKINATRNYGGIIHFVNKYTQDWE